MNYAVQKAIQNELNERIPPGPKGDPQNHLRHIVNSQRLHGNSFDQSVQTGVDLVRKLYPNFTPKILPARQDLDFNSQSGQFPATKEVAPLRCAASHS